MWGKDDDEGWEGIEGMSEGGSWEGMERGRQEEEGEREVQ